MNDNPELLSEVKKFSRKDQQVLYNKEIITRFQDIIFELGELKEFILDNYLIFLRTYIEHNKIKKGINWPIEASKFKDNSGNRINEYYKQCSYNYIFWHDLNEYCKNIDVAEAVSEKEFQKIKEKIAKVVQSVKEKRDYILVAYFDKAIEIGKKVPVDNLDDDEVYKISVEKLEDCLNGFNPSKDSSIGWVNYLAKVIKTDIQFEDRGGGKYGRRNKEIIAFGRYIYEYKSMHNGLMPDIEWIATKLNKTVEETLDLQARWTRINNNKKSKHINLEDKDMNEWINYHSVKNISVENYIIDKQLKSIVREVIKSLEPNLNQKEKAIINQRYLSDDPATLQNIADQFSLSRERIRQIEAELLGKIKDFLKYKKNIDKFSNIK